MDYSTYHIILVVAGALIAALSYFVVKLGLKSNDTVPPEVVAVLLNLLSDLASRTVTTEDDELVQKLRELVDSPVVAQNDGRP